MNVVRVLPSWLAALLVGCVSTLQSRPRPIPDVATSDPLVRGSESAARVISRDDQIEILAEVVRSFFRPMPSQARWIDPHRLASERSRAADSAATIDEDFAVLLAKVVGHSRVCVLDTSTCGDRPGGVLRFSPVYQAAGDTVITFAQYRDRNAKSETDTYGEMQFWLVPNGDGYRIARKNPAAGTPPQP